MPFLLNEYIVKKDGMGRWFDGIKHPTSSDLQIILKLELNSRHFYIICIECYAKKKKIKLCNEYEKTPPTSNCV